MSGKVWISGLFSNFEIGVEQGTRTKFYGHEWNPATSKLPLSPQEIRDASRRSEQGFALTRSEFPEAIAVYDAKRFRKIIDIFSAGPFFAVKGKLAEVLARFDLGEGGLIPFTIYQADLVTPLEGEYFLLNFGARKNTILPEQSRNIVKGVIRKATGEQLWDINSWFEDGEIVLSGTADFGPDLWMEEVLGSSKLFLRDALAQAIIEIGMKDVFRLKQCTIAGAV